MAYKSGDNVLSFTSRDYLVLILLVLLEKSVKLVLKLFNLSHVLVLDSKVIHFDLDISNLSSHLVLLLLIAHNRVKHAFEVLDLIVDLLDELVLGLLKDSFLNFDIHLSYLLDQGDRALTNLLDFFEDSSNLAILTFQILDKPIYALQILISIDIFRHLCPLILHELIYLLLVSDLTNDLLELSLELLDFLLLVAILNSLV